MKNRNTLLGISFIAVSILIYLIAPTVIDENPTYSPRIKHANQSYAKNVHGIAGAMDYYAERRMNISTGKMDIAAMIKADREVRNFGKAQKTAALGLNWYEMGPDNVGGRTRALLIDRSNPARLYAGSVAGGLWISNTAGFSWAPYDDDNQNLAVSCITQTTNGDIYFGTGESFGTTTFGGGTISTPGIIGRGIFKSSDGGNTFRQLPFTLPGNLNSNTDAWAFINRLAADPVDPLKVWAATNKGLYFSADSGDTWTKATCPACSLPDNFSGSNFTDIKVAADGTVAAASNGSSNSRNAYMAPAGQTDFVKINNRLTGINGALRIEFAFAPSDPNYVYVCATSGDLHNLYQSKDGGATFNIIVPGPNAGVFNGQGSYDLLLGVFPDDPQHILVGGVELYGWSGLDNTWDLVALTSFSQSGLYIHADKHIVVFSPFYSLSNEVYYIGNDGGLYASFDGGESYININIGYNVTQFYAIGTSREGWVAGGTQDNGNPFIDFTGNTTKSMVRNLPSGDGGYMQFSVINPTAFFWESQGGDANRSPDRGSGADGFFVPIMCTGGCDDDPAGGGASDGAWVTPLVIWENFNDTNSTETVQFVAGQSYSAGATIYIPSNNSEFPFEYITPVPLSVNDIIQVQDLVQSKFFVGLKTGIWMTKDVLDFSKAPAWYKLSASGGATCLEVSRDGDVIFVGLGSSVRRISGILGIGPGDGSTGDTPPNTTVPSSIITTTIYSSGQFLTGISIDPNNANNVVIALGNYGSATNVRLSINALGAATFSSIQGNLPNMPVYDALIEMHDSNRIILATEYGIYATDNGFDSSPNWTEENTGMARVASFMLIQQLHENNKCTGVINSGVIYVATHGRGIFKETAYANPPATEVCNLPVGIDEPGLIVPSIDMEFYPNPVVNGAGRLNFQLNQSAIVMLKIYNISGKLVDAVALGKKAAGEHTVAVSMNELGAGTYFVQLSSAGASATTKVMVIK